MQQDARENLLKVILVNEIFVRNKFNLDLSQTLIELLSYLHRVLLHMKNFAPSLS